MIPMTRKFIYSAAMLALALVAPAQVRKNKGQAGPALPEGAACRTEMAPMRDGVRLATDSACLPEAAPGRWF